MIKIRQQCWDRVTAKLGGITSDEAVRRLLKLGYQVEKVDGDWGYSYLADTEEEHQAVLGLEED